MYLCNLKHTKYEIHLFSIAHKQREIILDEYNVLNKFL